MTKQLSPTLQLALAKLDKSGLSHTDATTLGMEFIASAMTLHKSFAPLPAIKLPYFNPLKPKELDRPHPKWAEFYRIRYLKDPPQGFNGKPGPKYMQEPNTGMCAYFPRNVDWAKLIKDPGQELIITEGEFKAAKACKEGFPTIGLGGVHSFKQSKLGINFLPSLERIDWVRRVVTIIFDTDPKPNKYVISAIKELADELQYKGAIVYMVRLPQAGPEEEKTGLDDYLVSNGPVALEQQLKYRTPLLVANHLFDMNRNYVYVQDPGLIVKTQNGRKLSVRDFVGHAESTKRFEQFEIKPDGTVFSRPAKVSAAWIEWPLRNEVNTITYEPDQPRVIVDSKGVESYNDWSGWGCEPKAGEVYPFLDLVNHVFNGAEPAAKKWFLQWLAYPLKFPGTKLFTSVVIQGVVHGTGKSLLGMSMEKLYGENFSVINQRQLHEPFNDWAINKQFILGDDVAGSDKRADADIFKTLITQKRIYINKKFIPQYHVPDYINYMWTSNHQNAFFLEDSDRRFFVHEVTAAPLKEEFYVDYDLWLGTGAAGPAIFHYLKSLKTDDFNPGAPALRTAAKERMTRHGQSDHGEWVRTLKEAPDMVLRMGEARLKQDLFTATELMMLYQRERGENVGRVFAKTIGIELGRVGFKQVNDGRPVALANGSQGRYYAVRNVEKWADASYSVVKSYLDKVHPVRK